MHGKGLQEGVWAMSENLTDGTWCDLMQCHVVHEHVALDGAVVYSLAYKNAPHMSGAIKRATALKANVRTIVVYAPKRATTRYQKTSSGKWASVQC